MAASHTNWRERERCWRILGLQEGASLDEIKTAYRTKAKKCHPDKNPDDPKAKEKFQELNKAVKILTDDGDDNEEENYDDCDNADIIHFFDADDFLYHLLREYIAKRLFEQKFYPWTQSSYSKRKTQNFHPSNHYYSNGFEEDSNTSEEYSSEEQNDDDDIAEEKELLNVLKEKYKNEGTAEGDEDIEEEVKKFGSYQEWEQAEKKYRKEKKNKKGKAKLPPKPKPLRKKDQESQHYRRQKESERIQEEILQKQRDEKEREQRRQQREEVKRLEIEKEKKRSLLEQASQHMHDTAKEKKKSVQMESNNKDKTKQEILDCHKLLERERNMSERKKIQVAKNKKKNPFKADCDQHKQPRYWKNQEFSKSKEKHSTPPKSQVPRESSSTYKSQGTSDSWSWASRNEQERPCSKTDNSANWNWDSFQSFPPLVNVWETRKAKEEYLCELCPKTSADEDAMLLQAIELSKQQALEDEKMRQRKYSNFLPDESLDSVTTDNEHNNYKQQVEFLGNFVANSVGNCSGSTFGETFENRQSKTTFSNSDDRDVYGSGNEEEEDYKLREKHSSSVDISSTVAEIQNPVVEAWNTCSCEKNAIRKESNQEKSEKVYEEFKDSKDDLSSSSVEESLNESYQERKEFSPIKNSEPEPFWDDEIETVEEVNVTNYENITSVHCSQNRQKNYYQNSSSETSHCENLEVNDPVVSSSLRQTRNGTWGSNFGSEDVLPDKLHASRNDPSILLSSETLSEPAKLPPRNSSRSCSPFNFESVDRSEQSDTHSDESGHPALSFQDKAMRQSVASHKIPKVIESSELGQTPNVCDEIFKYTTSETLQELTAPAHKMPTSPRIDPGELHPTTLSSKIYTNEAFSGRNMSSDDIREQTGNLSYSQTFTPDISTATNGTFHNTNDKTGMQSTHLNENNNMPELKTSSMPRQPTTPSLGMIPGLLPYLPFDSSMLGMCGFPPQVPVNPLLLLAMQQAYSSPQCQEIVQQYYKTLSLYYTSMGLLPMYESLAKLQEQNKAFESSSSLPNEHSPSNFPSQLSNLEGNSTSANTHIPQAQKEHFGNVADSVTNDSTDAMKKEKLISPPPFPAVSTHSNANSQKASREISHQGNINSYVEHLGGATGINDYEKINSQAAYGSGDIVKPDIRRENSGYKGENTINQEYHISDHESIRRVNSGSFNYDRLVSIDGVDKLQTESKKSVNDRYELSGDKGKGWMYDSKGQNFGANNCEKDTREAWLGGDDVCNKEEISKKSETVWSERNEPLEGTECSTAYDKGMTTTKSKSFKNHSFGEESVEQQVMPLKEDWSNDSKCTSDLNNKEHGGWLDSDNVSDSKKQSSSGWSDDEESISQSNSSVKSKAPCGWSTEASNSDTHNRHYSQANDYDKNYQEVPRGYSNSGTKQYNKEGWKNTESYNKNSQRNWQHADPPESFYGADSRNSFSSNFRQNGSERSFRGRKTYAQKNSGYKNNYPGSQYRDNSGKDFGNSFRNDSSFHSRPGGQPYRSELRQSNLNNDSYFGPQRNKWTSNQNSSMDDKESRTPSSFSRRS